MNLLHLQALDKALDALLNDPQKQHAKDSVLNHLAFAVKAELLKRQSDASGWAQAAPLGTGKLPMTPSRIAHLRQLSDLRKSVQELSALMPTHKNADTGPRPLTGTNKQGQVEGALPGTRLTRQHLEHIEKLANDAANQLNIHALELAADAVHDLVPKKVTQASMDKLKQTYEAVAWLKQEQGGFKTGSDLEHVHNAIETFIKKTDLAIVDSLIGEARPITVTALKDWELIGLKQRIGAQDYKPDLLLSVCEMVEMEISTHKGRLFKNFSPDLGESIKRAAEETDAEGLLNCLLREAMHTHAAVTALAPMGKSMSDEELTGHLRTALRGSPFVKGLANAQSLHRCLNSGDGKLMRELLSPAASNPQAAFAARFLNLLDTALNAWLPVQQAPSQQTPRNVKQLTPAGVVALRTILQLDINKSAKTPETRFKDLGPRIMLYKGILARATAQASNPRKVLDAISFMLTVTSDATGLMELQMANAPMLKSTDASVKLRAKKLAEALEPALLQATTPGTIAEMLLDELQEFDALLKKRVTLATPDPKHTRLRTAVDAQIRLRIGRAKTEFQAALRAAIAEPKASQLPARLLHSSNQAHAAAKTFASLNNPFDDTVLDQWISEVVQSTNPSNTTALQRDLTHGQGRRIIQGLTNRKQLRQANPRAQFAFNYLEKLAATVNTHLGPLDTTADKQPNPPTKASTQVALRRYLHIGVQKAGNVVKYFDLQPAILDARAAVAQASGRDLKAIGIDEEKALKAQCALLLDTTIDIQELQGLQTVVRGLDNSTAKDGLPQMAEDALAYAKLHHPIA
ncbi:hypothetical protein [Hydrogenophaga sp. BPS33]|uniref:hypothetical protein n=1 Tax=Hydrogenophaga sp. BPS33 TaxID=2651974 RepID=UPI0013205149|nr:hypothetical protein [Hydrogenophaga sp. BPS33]QHE86919.1 hypothetical protein F9K07_19445 [Hydrogenophaga sp. BPS33]